MFCPKCGTQNPETGRFCRSCGADLGNVSAALSGKLPISTSDAGGEHLDSRARRRAYDLRRRQDPNELYGDAVKQILSGVGFFVVSMVLFFTGVANGRTWWWAMLFPAFGCLGKGVSDYLKSKRMEKTQVGFSSQTQNTLNPPPVTTALPPTQTAYVHPESRYKTGDLVPPSVVEDTTRHLQMDSEGKTMTLPKK